VNRLPGPSFSGCPNTLVLSSWPSRYSNVDHRPDHALASDALQLLGNQRDEVAAQQMLTANRWCLSSQISSRIGR
jgi:hypothetical protein